MPTPDFWQALDSLISMSEIVIDRPRGTAHPHYPDFIYPLDYGYLRGTLSNDGSGIDVWRGNMREEQVTALIVNVDIQKRDSEIKLLIGCTAEEQQTILHVHDQTSWGGAQSALLIERQPALNGTPAQKLALWADILRDCSARGLYFASNIYDRENYQKVQDVALELFALASSQPLAVVEPLRTTIFARPAPFPVSDAAIIDDAGKILLIRRSDNALWAMPGGALEVGETPAQGAVREALEESGITCEPIALVGVYDSRFCGTTSQHQLYQFSFLCRPLHHIKVIDPPSHAHEVLETRWFPEHALPDNLDSGHVRRIPQAFRVWHGEQRTFFDQMNSASNEPIILP